MLRLALILLHKKQSHPQRKKAEEEGFEPPVPFDTTVFKTVTLSRSVTPPGYKYRPVFNEPGRNRYFTR